MGLLVLTTNQFGIWFCSFKTILRRYLFPTQEQLNLFLFCRVELLDKWDSSGEFRLRYVCEMG